jgi:osmotically-inducible protein OsmY
VTNSTELQHYVQEELEWEPSVEASHIGVTCTESGVITLSGMITSYAERVTAERDEAERAAWAAPGVLDVEDHLRWTSDD